MKDGSCWSPPIVKYLISSDLPSGIYLVLLLLIELSNLGILEVDTPPNEVRKMLLWSRLGRRRWRSRR